MSALEIGHRLSSCLFLHNKGDPRTVQNILKARHWSVLLSATAHLLYGTYFAWIPERTANRIGWWTLPRFPIFSRSSFSHQSSPTAFCKPHLQRTIDWSASHSGNTVPNASVAVASTCPFFASREIAHTFPCSCTLQLLVLNPNKPPINPTELPSCTNLICHYNFLLTYRCSISSRIICH